MHIPVGYQRYTFQFQLPNNIPSSFEHRYGHVRYTVKAVLDRPWKFDQECKTAFTVVSILDLNTERHKCVRDRRTWRERVLKELAYFFVVAGNRRRGVQKFLHLLLRDGLGERGGQNSLVRIRSRTDDSHGVELRVVIELHHDHGDQLEIEPSERKLYIARRFRCECQSFSHGGHEPVVVVFLLIRSILTL